MAQFEVVSQALGFPDDVTLTSRPDSQQSSLMTAPALLVVDDSPTIRKVVSTLLQARGYRAVTAADGREALLLLREQPIDLVLLDFVMPIMNGYQFCRELRADPNLRQLPVVLMSAKGDKIRGPFLRETGAIDAITKPFDPRALYAVVETALRKPTASTEAAAESEGSDEETSDFAAIDAISDPAERAAAIARTFSRHLGRLLWPSLDERILARGRSALESLLERTLEVPHVRRLSGILELLNRSDRGHAALAGDLGFISIAEVLQLLELQRQHGALTITYGDREIILYLRGGRIDLARSTNLPASFRLGRLLVEDGVVSRDQLTAFLNRPAPVRPLLGEGLIELHLATTSQVQQALKRQSSELVYEAVRWKHGRFTFEVGQGSPEADLAALALAPGALLMEGFRRVDEWQRIEGSFQFDDVLLTDPSAVERIRERSELTALEEQVLGAVDGTRRVREIVDSVDAGTFDVCKTLYQLISSGLVRRNAP